MRKFAIGAMLLVVPVTGLHAMTVAAFLQKADALQRRGALALFSRDLGRLKAEVREAGQAARAEQAAALRAGRRPAFCLPEQAQTDSQELLQQFRAIPPAQRASIEVRDAFRTFVIRKYPCRA